MTNLFGRLAIPLGIIAILAIILASPRSALRGWLAAERPPAGTHAGSPVPPGGATAEPGDLLVVEFVKPAATATALVRVTDLPVVRVNGDVDAATISQGDGVIRVACDGKSGRFDVHVPRSATRVELRVTDRTLFEWSGGQATTIWPMATDSTWLIPLTP